MNKFFYLTSLQIAFLFIFIAFCGCEDTPKADDVNRAFQQNSLENGFGGGQSASSSMVISPKSAELDVNGAQQVFEVTGGTPPYSWSVVDISLGSMVAQGGTSAVYERSVAGDNSIRLQDGSGSAAFAKATQP